MEGIVDGTSGDNDFHIGGEAVGALLGQTVLALGGEEGGNLKAEAIAEICHCRDMTNRMEDGTNMMLTNGI